MSDTSSNRDYMLLSRGKWHMDKSEEEIQAAIDAFYRWYDGLVAAGRFKPGHRLTTEAQFIDRTGVIDGPFAETKEVVGGYWFIVAGSLQEAAALAAESPCLTCGLYYEIRPVENERGSAYRVTNETPKHI